MGKKKFICPRCGLETEAYPALSRKDNKTEICPRCGIEEAIGDWADSMLAEHWKKLKEKGVCPLCGADVRKAI